MRLTKNIMSLIIDLAIMMCYCEFQKYENDRKRILCNNEEGIEDLIWFCNTDEWCSGPTSKTFATRGTKGLCKKG